MTSQATPRPFCTRELLLLLLPLFAVALGYGAILPVLPPMLMRFHESAITNAPLHAGLLAAAYMGAFVVAAPPWGKIVDLFGQRVVFLVGLLGYAVATLWLGSTTSLMSAYAARFVAGLFAAGLQPATASVIVARSVGSARARYLAWSGAASVLGFLVGPALTGWIHGIVAALNDVGTAHIITVPIWTTAAIAVVAMLGAAGGTSSGVPVAATAPAARPAQPDAHRRILLLSALAALALGAFEVGLSLQSQRTWGWSPNALGWLFGVCSSVMLVLQLVLFEPLHRAIQPPRLLIGGFALSALGFALLAGTSAYGLVAVLVAVIAFGAGLLQTTLSVALADSAGTSVGAAIGGQNSASNLGQAAGSLVAGLLFSIVPSAPFGVIAVLALTAAALIWRLTRAQANWLGVPIADSTSQGGRPS